MGRDAALRVNVHQGSLSGRRGWAGRTMAVPLPGAEGVPDLAGQGRRYAPPRASAPYRSGTYNSRGSVARS
jgi:hypothetical protein